jgi:hypothetical protein
MATQDPSARLSELDAQISVLTRHHADGGEGPMLKALLDDMAKRHAVEGQLRQAQEWLHLAQEAGRVCAYTFDFASGRLH